MLKEIIREIKKPRASGITFYSLVEIGFGLLLLSLTIFLEFYETMYYGYILFGFYYLLIGISLYLLQNWSRILHLILAPFFIGFGIYLIIQFILLCRPGTGVEAIGTFFLVLLYLPVTIFNFFLIIFLLEPETKKEFKH